MGKKIKFYDFFITKNFQITIFTDGIAAIDGGSMFGVVPKVLWNKYYVPDRLNRITIVMACMLIKYKNKNILVETGIGDKFDKKFATIYKINKKMNLLKSLKLLDVSPDDITIVVNTHLHFDHCGYNTIYNDNGKVVATFKNAKYLIQKKEWLYALNPDERSKFSYIEANFLPLEKSHQIELVDGDVEIEKGVKLLYTGGHSAGHQSVLIHDEDKTFLFTGDLVPTSFNIKINYTSAFDLFPVDLMLKKKELLAKAKEEGWILIFPHDFLFPCGSWEQVWLKYFNKNK
ncbi:MAG: MBL fold metallo-hydrolase [Endomicrobia bacterium]|nr:MBL fold metallo-hydrolase [Endomicrobiia bacterium]